MGGKTLGISVAEKVGLSESVGPGNAAFPEPPKPTIFNVVEVYYEDGGGGRELVRRVKLDKNHFVGRGQAREVTVKVVGQ